MTLLIEGLDEILTEVQKEKLYPIARQWVDDDQITLENISYVEFGQRSDITTKKWDYLKDQMLENFKTKEDDLKRFEQNDEKECSE